MVPALSRPTFQPPTVSLSIVTIASCIAWPSSTVEGCNSAGRGSRFAPLRVASTISFAVALILSLFMLASLDAFAASQPLLSACVRRNQGIRAGQGRAANFALAALCGRGQGRRQRGAGILT